MEYLGSRLILYLFYQLILQTSDLKPTLTDLRRGVDCPVSSPRVKWYEWEMGEESDQLLSHSVPAPC